MESDEKKLHILIVDDHPMLRRGVKELLQLEDNIGLVSEASSGKEAITIVTGQESAPDLILLDLNMKGMDGLQTLKELRNMGVVCKIVMFSVSDSHEDVIAALNLGADGYLLKETEPEDLIDYIYQAVDGATIISAKLAGVLASEIGNRNAVKKPSVEGLTLRERQIIKQVSTGMSNKMIGAKLKITEGTVKVHVKNLLKKLKMRSRVEIAIWAVENHFN